jgi:predicted TIM-barrel fold metal-dependent hydrolase
MPDITIGRRGVVAGLLGSAAMVMCRARSVRAQEVSFSAGTAGPSFQVPANACDCHMHIYDSRFPYVPDATLRPPEAIVADSRLLQKRLGLERAVVVTPSSYGTDNSATLAAIEELGSNARGIAVVDPSVSDEELQRLDGLGIRGIRFNLSVGGVTTVEMIEELAKRINELGWHVQVVIPGDELVNQEALFQRLPTPLVIDHMGRFPASAGVDHPAFGVIRKLLDGGRTYVKLSGAYLNSEAGPPDYADTIAVGRALVEAAPARMLWGSDWPHPTITTSDKPLPDDAVLLDLLAEYAPDEAVRNQILVDNPEEVYGFSTSS